VATGFRTFADTKIAGEAGVSTWASPYASKAPAGGVGTQSGQVQSGAGEGVSSPVDNNSGICEMPCMVQMVSHCTGAALALPAGESPNRG